MEIASPQIRNVATVGNRATLALLVFPPARRRLSQERRDLVTRGRRQPLSQPFSGNDCISPVVSAWPTFAALDATASCARGKERA